MDAESRQWNFEREDVAEKNLLQKVTPGKLWLLDHIAEWTLTERSNSCYLAWQMVQTEELSLIKHGQEEFTWTEPVNSGRKAVEQSIKMAWDINSTRLLMMKITMIDDDEDNDDVGWRPGVQGEQDQQSISCR